jgi:hypothetical protein
MLCCRPFDANKTSNETGAWRWVSLPQAVLVNGKGFYGDCNLIGELHISAAACLVAFLPSCLCMPAPLLLQQTARLPASGRAMRLVWA